MYYQYQQAPQKTAPPLPRQKLKCLVLGAAGAGKTSILRRHFRQVFENSRVPTLGSDFYTGRMSIRRSSSTVEKKLQEETTSTKKRQHGQEEETDPEGGLNGTNTTHDVDENDKEEEEEVIVNIQMWDTPGRERYYMEKQHHRHAQNHKDHRSVVAASLSDSFFRNVSAIMLVYDMTSSTSFTQLLRWYADLMEMKNHAQSQSQDASSSSLSCSFPILIVGNKLDILNSKILRHNNNNDDSSSCNKKQQHRDIMGLKGTFRGHDFRYEYCATAALEHQPPQPLSSSSFNSQQQQQHQNQNQHQRNNHRRHYDYDNSSSIKNKTMPSVMKIYSSVLSGNDNTNTTNNRNSWTAQPHDEQYMNLDGSYLNSLLNSEDGSHPDRDLVILWCMRNGLQHMQVSAATGEGVEDAMEMLVRLALQNKEKQEQEQLQQQAANAAAMIAAAAAAAQHQQHLEQSALPPRTTTATLTGIMDTVSTTINSVSTSALTISNGIAPHDNGNHIIASASAAAATSPPSSSMPDNTNTNSNQHDTNSLYQIQRRYPKLDLRERYGASKEDQYKCFSCFLLGRIVMQWFRER